MSYSEIVLVNMMIRIIQPATVRSVVSMRLSDSSRMANMIKIKNRESSFFKWKYSKIEELLKFNDKECNLYDL